jgi:putative inorganic carbon (HCO3(-)) transporter
MCDLVRSQLFLVPVLLAAPLLLFPARFPSGVSFLSALLLAAYVVWMALRNGSTVLPTVAAVLPLTLAWSISLVTAHEPVFSAESGSMVLGISALLLFSLLRSEFAAIAWALVFATSGLLLGIFGPFITIYQMPRKLFRLEWLESSILDTGEILDANILGCLLAVATVVSLALNPIYSKRTLNPVIRRCGIWLSPILLILTVLTQSRASILGLGVAFGIVVFLRLRDHRRFVLLALLLATFVLLAVGPFAVVGFFSADGQFNSLENRFELWNRSLYAIRDFPATGIGIGMFQAVVPKYYPLFLTPPDRVPFHAHNLYLQVALDLGLPGLVALLSLIGFSTIVCLRAIRQGQAVAATYFGAVVVVLVNGLLDAPLWLNKPHAVFFFLMGVMISLGSPLKQGASADWRAKASGLLLVLVLSLQWLLISLLAVSFVQDYFWVTMVLAVAGGLYLGWEAARRVPLRVGY